MKTALYARLRQALGAQERCVLFTVVEGDGAGSQLLALESGETVGDAPAALAGQATDLIAGARSKTIDVDGLRVLCEVYGPPPRLLVYGAVDLADHLCSAAKLLGWTTIVGDARPAFLTAERMQHADQLIAKWPEDCIAEVAPDVWTAAVVLTHDDKFDLPFLKAILATPVCYIGALGSRRNQERRRGELLALGVTEAELERIAGPCGLDIGADTQPETAISIVGEILAVRAGRSGGRLQESKQRIHVEA